MAGANNARGEGVGRKARKGKGRGSPFPSLHNPLSLFIPPSPFEDFEDGRGLHE